ncbi:hypothetical protein OF83DRAFT_731405 [Amylostereum chailletii]|nr:hypothetical protein OF83DRAFT_731405 [Amylostereum chailletii]
MLSRYLLVVASLAAGALTGPTLTVQEPQELIPFDDVKVPVTLGVMSRCPDALLCEAVFDQVLKKVADKIDYELTYIAEVDESEPVFGVSCKHGSDECAGNVQQLCVAKYRPLKTWWAFVMCQNYQGKDKIGRADIALKCARTAGIDWETSDVGQCAGLDGSGTGEEGIELLKQSSAYTKELLIERSCTILINEEHVCIHDGTWKECENGHSATDFIRQIETEYRKINDILPASDNTPLDA